MPDTDDKIRGAWMAALRHMRGLTQEEVATELGQSVMTYLRTEAGRRSPKITELQQIAEVIGVDLIDLVDTPPALRKVTAASGAYLTSQPVDGYTGQLLEAFA